MDLTGGVKLAARDPNMARLALFCGPRLEIDKCKIDSK